MNNTSGAYEPDIKESNVQSNVSFKDVSFKVLNLNRLAAAANALKVLVGKENKSRSYTISISEKWELFH